MLDRYEILIPPEASSATSVRRTGPTLLATVGVFVVLFGVGLLLAVAFVAGMLISVVRGSLLSTLPRLVAIVLLVVSASTVSVTGRRRD